MRGRTILIPATMAAVAAIVAGVHWDVLSARATLFDDQQYVLENPLVQDPGWASAGRFFGEMLRPSTVMGYYQPLAMVSLMLDHAAGGRPDNLRPFHRTSLGLHVANTMLVVVLVWGLFGRIWPALLMGLLFGVHPLTVEPIAWTGERKTPLTTLFSLGCLIAHVRYARTGAWRWYGASLGAYLLALLSKPTSTPVAAMLLLMDYWPLRRLGRRAVAEKVPFFVLAVVSSAVTVLSQGEGLLPGQEEQQRVVSVWLVACHNLSFYLGSIVWPWQLSPVYPFPEPTDLSNPTVLGMVLATFVLAAAVLISWRWTRAILVGTLLFVVAVFPTFLNVGYSLGIAADKYVYLPSIGLLLVLGWELSRLWESDGVWRRAGIMAAVGAVAAVQAVATRHHLAHWRDTETLYRYMIGLTPDFPPAYNNLGNALVKEGKIDEAIGCYREAVRIRPYYPTVYNNLGLALARQGRLDEAAGQYREAIKLQSEDANPHIRVAFAQAHNNLANVLADQGKLDEAVRHYREAIRIKGDYPNPHNNLGAALVKLGRVDEAIGHFSEALRLRVGDADTHHNFGLALVRQGRYQQAVDVFRAGLTKKADHADMMNSLAWVLATCPEASIRNGAEAVRLAEEVNQKSGGANARVLDTLAAAYAEAGRFAEAVAAAEKALANARGKDAQTPVENVEKRLGLYREGRPYRE